MEGIRNFPLEKRIEKSLFCDFLKFIKKRRNFFWHKGKTPLTETL